MLEPWLEIATVAERIDAASEAAGIDLRAHGTTSDADAIRDTAVAQPLLVSTAIATGRELLGDTIPGLTAGHSIGEFGAAAFAGVLTDAEAMSLVSVRARAMAEAAANSEATSMAAVLGGDPDEVAAKLADLGLTPANMNGGGQVVAAGSKEAITALVADGPEKARVIELQVAGAFHTEYMAPAVEVLAAAAAQISPAEPQATLLSNADGAAVESGADALSRMVKQIANPVRWDLCQEALVAAGVSALVEVAPGGVLTGLAKRSKLGIPAVAIKTPEDLDKARDLIKEHA